ncbi:hypothetical protein FISHEDRAFT_62448 [Fistulina hepatica ATCC 64428]|nr:hypothetical protein FISHEDRAFT_62448 [Fistulina hepatica ATCC 64428]
MSCGYLANDNHLLFVFKASVIADCSQSVDCEPFRISLVWAAFGYRPLICVVNASLQSIIDIVMESLAKNSGGVGSTDVALKAVVSTSISRSPDVSDTADVDVASVSGTCGKFSSWRTACQRPPIAVGSGGGKPSIFVFPTVGIIARIVIEWIVQNIAFGVVGIVARYCDEDLSEQENDEDTESQARKDDDIAAASRAHARFGDQLMGEQGDSSVSRSAGDLLGGFVVVRKAWFAGLAECTADGILAVVNGFSHPGKAAVNSSLRYAHKRKIYSPFQDS